MEELDLLKRDWKEREKNMPKYSFNEISKMLWKRSSSIVKWIFIISICEFVLLVSLPFLFPAFYAKNDDLMQMLHLKTLSDALTYISYAVLLMFMYLFYKNYQKISVTDNVKHLMQNILNTRRTVKYYVLYNLIMMGVFSIIIFISQLKYDPALIDAAQKAATNGNTTTFWLIMIGMFILVLLAILGFVWLFYQLIYGILLRKLKKNYKELKKMEV
jgi:hypothetical protein